MSDSENFDSKNKDEQPEKKPSSFAWPNPNPSPLPSRSRFNFSNNKLAPTPPPPPPSAPTAPPRPKTRRPANFARGKELMEQERSPLVFNVAQLLRDTEGSTRQYDVEADELLLSKEGESIQKAYNIQGQVRFTKVRHEILAQGHFKADVDMTCVRCLEDFKAPIEIDLEEEFTPSIDVGTGLPTEAEEDEEEKLQIDPNHMLHLGEALRQQFLVSMPMQPICREDCPGLYSYLEKVNSDVEDEDDEDDENAPVDNRWAALAKLLEPKDGENN